MLSGQKPLTPLLEVVGRPVGFLAVVQRRGPGGRGDDRGVRGPVSEGALAIVRAPRQGRGGGVGEGTPPDRLLHLARRHGAEVVAASVPSRHGRPQVDYEGEDVEAEDEGDDPLQDRGVVEVAAVPRHAEADGEAELDDDERQLHPEGEPQDSVLAVFYWECGLDYGRVWE